MPRSIPPISLRAILQSQTEEIFVALLKIDPGEGADKIYLTNNSQNVVNSDATYNARPFDVRFPNDIEGQISQFQLVVENASQQLVCLVRNLLAPFTTRLQIVRVDAPDEILAEWDFFALVQSSITTGTISFTLSLDQLLAEPYPEGIMTPENFPGIF